MKNFDNQKYVEQYHHDVRKKIPGYDLMFELIFRAVLPVETDSINNALLIGGGVKEIEYLLGSCQPNHLTIVDSSHEMIKEYKKMVTEVSHDIMLETFETCTLSCNYDFVSCLLVLHFVLEPKVFLAKIYQSMSKDGVLFLSVFTNYHLDWWQRYCKSMGLTKDQLELTKSQKNIREINANEVEKILYEVGFKKVEKISQILSTELWIVKKS